MGRSRGNARQGSSSRPSAHVIGRDEHILGKSLAMDVEKKRKR